MIKHAIMAWAVIALLLLGAGTSLADEASERRLIIRVVENIATGADLHDWQLVKNSFAPKVMLDYTSMTGGEPVELTPDQIIQAWSGFLPGFELTRHQLSNQRVKIDGDKAASFSYVSALHYIKGASPSETWTVHGFYDHSLMRTPKGWKVIAMKFTLNLQEGNQTLPALAGKQVKPLAKEVSFNSRGSLIKGILYLPADYGGKAKLPAIMVGGSWTTVKEQMAGAYAREMARMGFAALAFDHRGYGQSQGEPRGYESPALKIQDFRAALDFLLTRPEVDQGRIAGLGVCASAGYLAAAAVRDSRLKAFAAVAGWLHEPETVKLVYGGEKGVKTRLDAADKAQARYKQSGEVAYIPTISATDSTAAMYGNFDYYLNEKRGAIPQWEQKFAVMSWRPWLEFNPIALADKLNIPALLIHSPNAALPMGVKKFFNQLKGPKSLQWMQGSHFDFYDNPRQMRQAARQAARFFRSNL